MKDAEWRSLLREQEESGQSVAAFCRTRELRKSRFYYWKKRLREVATPQFIELQVAKPSLRMRHLNAPPVGTIEVRLSNGRSLIVAPEFDASHLRAVMAVVESAS
ncbi:MAG TPA: hypothetical protein VM912_05445 [Terriglobales bacterium]|nr:hypothetical protein [Terriglobales bacterium]